MLHALILSVGIGGRLLSKDSSAIVARWTGVDPAFGSRTHRGRGGGSHPPAAARASAGSAGRPLSGSIEPYGGAWPCCCGPQGGRRAHAGARTAWLRKYWTPRTLLQVGCLFRSRPWTGNRERGCDCSAAQEMLHEFDPLSALRDRTTRRITTEHVIVFPRCGNFSTARTLLDPLRII